MDDKNLRLYIAELIGTFAVVFVSAGVVCASGLTYTQGQPAPHLLGIAIAQGFIYAAALAATLPLGGGYLNPAITIMLYVFKRFELGKTAGLVLVQLLGAAVAGGLLRLFFAYNQILMRDTFLGTPHINLHAFDVAGITPGVLFSGLGIEIGLTFILTFVIFATLIDPRSPRVLGTWGRWLSPLWVGLTLAAVVLIGFAWTGGATNPARYFGTVIWELTVPGLQGARPYADHMAFWIGPIIGALLAGGAYIYLVLPAEPEKSVAAGTPVAAAGKVKGAGTLFRSKK